MIDALQIILNPANLQIIRTKVCENNRQLKDKFEVEPRHFTVKNLENVKKLEEANVMSLWTSETKTVIGEMRFIVVKSHAIDEQKLIKEER